MKRLIDADELKEYIAQDWYLDLLLTQQSKSELKEKLENMIDSIPLAYNVDRVSERLNNMILNHESECVEKIRTGVCSEYEACTECVLTKAKEIVQEG